MNLLALAFTLFPYTLPVGHYSYQGKVITENIRIAETVDHTSQLGQKRIKELKADDFTCLRQSQIKTICAKNLGPQETTADVQDAVAKKLSNFTFDFETPDREPESYQDLFDSHRWNVYVSTRLGAKTVEMYQFVHYYETERQVLAFPVSEDQPVGNLEWINGRLGLKLVFSEKINNQTYGHIIVAYFEK